jgi:hypothetical protein
MIFADPAWRHARVCNIFSLGMRAASSVRIAAVQSVDWSSTTMISAISGCAATDSTARAMDASSLRAGMMTETINLS